MNSLGGSWPHAVSRAQTGSPGSAGSPQILLPRGAHSGPGRRGGSAAAGLPQLRAGSGYCSGVTNGIGFPRFLSIPDLQKSANERRYLFAPIPTQVLRSSGAVRSGDFAPCSPSGPPLCARRERLLPPPPSAPAQKRLRAWSHGCGTVTPPNAARVDLPASCSWFRLRSGRGLVATKTASRVAFPAAASRRPLGGSPPSASPNAPEPGTLSLSRLPKSACAGFTSRFAKPPPLPSSLGRGPCPHTGDPLSLKPNFALGPAGCTRRRRNPGNAAGIASCLSFGICAPSQVYGGRLENGRTDGKPPAASAHHPLGHVCEARSRGGAEPGRGPLLLLSTLACPVVRVPPPQRGTVLSRAPRRWCERPAPRLGVSSPPPLGVLRVWPNGSRFLRARMQGGLTPKAPNLRTVPPAP